MKKQDYFISMKNGTALVSGYVYSIGSIRIGITRTALNGKDLGAWNVTELFSGCCVTFGQSTLKEAINDFREKYLDRVERALLQYQKNGGQDVNPGLIPRYTVWTVYTRKTA